MIILSFLLICLEVLFYVKLFAQRKSKARGSVKFLTALFLLVPLLTILVYFYAEVCMEQLEPFLWWIAIGLGIPILIIRLGSERYQKGGDKL